MRNGLLASVAALLGGAGLALGQAPATPLPPLPSVPPSESINPALAATPCCADDTAGRFWGGAEYLLWWTRNSSSPPLLITGPAPVVTPGTGTNVPIPTSPNFIGLLTLPQAANSLTLGSGGVPIRGDNVDGDRSGARFTLGGWLDSQQTVGVEASYFFLTSKSATLNAGSTGSPALAIPFLNAVTGAEAGFPIAQPSTTATTQTFVNITPASFVHLFDTAATEAASGRVAIITSSRLQGAEANGVLGSDLLGKHVRLLAGFRWAQLDEGLGIVSSVSSQSNTTTTFEPALGLPTGAIPVVNESSSLTTRLDQFDAHNNFYGAQLGLRGEYEWNRFSILAGAKAALGTMNQSVSIFGASQFSTTTTVTPTQNFLLAGIPLVVANGAANVTTTASGHSAGGLFAQPTNIGNHSRNVFAVVPEADLKLGYQVTSHLRATVGYSFLYMSSVVRPGDQIDRVINPNLLTSPPTTGAPFRPVFQFKTTDYWAQGVDFGLEFRF